MQAHANTPVPIQSGFQTDDFFFETGTDRGVRVGAEWIVSVSKCIPTALE